MFSKMVEIADLHVVRLYIPLAILISDAENGQINLSSAFPHSLWQTPLWLTASLEVCSTSYLPKSCPAWTTWLPRPPPCRQQPTTLGNTDSNSGSSSRALLSPSLPLWVPPVSHAVALLNTITALRPFFPVSLHSAIIKIKIEMSCKSDLKDIITIWIIMTSRLSLVIVLVVGFLFTSPFKHLKYIDDKK